MAALINLMLMALFFTCAKKDSLAGANSACSSCYSEEMKDVVNSRTLPSLFVWRDRNGDFEGLNKHKGLDLLLLLAGDIEICPGPSTRCNTCNKTIIKNLSSHSCVSCGRIIHLKCLCDRLEFGHERGYCKDCCEHEGVMVSETVDCESPFNDGNIFFEGRGFKASHQNTNGLVKKTENIDTTCCWRK